MVPKPPTAPILGRQWCVRVDVIMYVEREVSFVLRDPPQCLEGADDFAPFSPKPSAIREQPCCSPRWLRVTRGEDPPPHVHARQSSAVHTPTCMHAQCQRGCHISALNGQQLCGVYRYHVTTTPQHYALEGPLETPLRQPSTHPLALAALSLGRLLAAARPWQSGRWQRARRSLVPSSGSHAAACEAGCAPLCLPAHSCGCAASTTMDTSVDAGGW